MFIFPVISIAVVSLKAFFIRKALYDFPKSELKLHDTEEKPSDFNITTLMGSVTIFSEVLAVQWN